MHPEKGFKTLNAPGSDRQGEPGGQPSPASWPPAPETLLPLLRHRLPATGPEARRLWHGRGGTAIDWSWLSIDWYPPVLHLIAYREIPEAFARQLADLLDPHLQPRPATVYLQRRDLCDAPHLLLQGEHPAAPVARENGLTFRLDFGRGRNIGFFPDMAAGRRWVRERAEGKRILNLFAYTCAFSVAALAGGAVQVVNLDMNRNVLARGRENHLLNGIDPRRAGFLAHDLFKSFGKLRRLGPFDLVIADPPDIQGASFRSERDWPKLLRKLPELLTANGEFLACVSSPRLGRRFLLEMINRHTPFLQLLEKRTAGPDFPERDPDKGLHLMLYTR
ncbi:class I SAM-dependent methyltransferase [Geothermobacter ehrlichii]|uniref:class I SAM-dependent methyltransferase n=1 Tax=Geothermobacter ehrlichii TaxID=213224 RepID=UPI001CA33D97|nr:class I SAM-dependent methyltransferase [Geothermobacter ehrlichii]